MKVGVSMKVWNTYSVTTNYLLNEKILLEMHNNVFFKKGYITLASRRGSMAIFLHLPPKTGKMSLVLWISVIMWTTTNWEDKLYLKLYLKCIGDRKDTLIMRTSWKILFFILFRSSPFWISMCCQGEDRNTWPPKLTFLIVPILEIFSLFLVEGKY